MFEKLNFQLKQDGNNILKTVKKNNVKQDHCIVPLENMEQNIFPYVK